MIISSNSLSKNGHLMNSNILARTDGFNKAASSNKKIAEVMKSHSNIHTSSGLRRVTKEYNISSKNI